MLGVPRVLFLFQFILLITGLLVSLISSNVLGVWIGLELNMFSFLPLLLKGGKSALLYFIVQALGTVFLLIGFIKPNFGFFLLLGLGLKLGLIPLYIWVLAIVKEIRWEKV